MINRYPRLTVLAMIAALALSKTSYAEVFCVTSSLGLQIALGTAASNFEDDEIRIEQGTYAIQQFPFVQPFTFNGGSTHGGDSDDLTISGGWITFSGNPCGRQRSNASALDTILDGQGLDRVMHIDVGEQADVTITGLTFLAGSPPGLDTTRGGGLDLGSVSEIGGTFKVERCAFVSNTAATASAVVISRSRTIHFNSNLVVGNTSRDPAAAVELLQINQNGIYAINNTIINNVTESNATVNVVTGLRVRVEGTSQSLIANNILWGNERNDIIYGGPGLHTSQNNTIESAANLPDSEQNNVSIAPLFESGGFLNFNLDPQSPLANSGLSPPPDTVPFPTPFNLAWSLPDTDAGGRPRITNGRVDIGAFETLQDFLFSDRFD
ncbi:MAG: choice-of-anchor Q domain-containing protein [Pseudomonadota bacterium]